MLRIAVVADSHFDETSRFGECVAIHDWIAEEIARREVHLVLHSGDVFERKSTPRERNAVAAWLLKVADYCPVVVVKGNHDALEDLAIFSRLDSRYPVIVEEAAAVHDVAVEVGETMEAVSVACLAWPRKAELLASTGAHGQDAQAQAQEALQGILRGLGAELAQRQNGPRILLAHALVTGSRTSTGQPLVGHDMELDLSELALAKADFYALGHIHLSQFWTISGAPVVFPGSPRRCTFGEAEAKSFVIAEFGQPAGLGGAWACTGWGEVPTPARAMLFGEDEWGTNEEGTSGWLVGWHGLDPEQANGAEIRLRYLVDSDQRDGARAAAAKFRDELVELGAVHVLVEEEVRPTQRAKAPEVARAQTLAAKLAAFWASRGTAPDDARRARLLGKLSALEEEVRRAA